MKNKVAKNRKIRKSNPKIAHQGKSKNVTVMPRGIRVHQMIAV
jgi:hypothetical protein